jgi:hypothetical protein
MPIINILKWSLGTAFIPLDAIEMHSQQRKPHRHLIEIIKAELNQGTNRMETNPIHLILPSRFSTPELLRQLHEASPTSGLLQVPQGVKFACIDGQHRVQAAKEHLKVLLNQGSSNISHREHGWWATVYDEGTIFDLPLMN